MSAVELDLNVIEARANAASEAPWTAHPDGLVWAPRPGDPVSASTEPEDAAFIAAARTDVPKLVVEVRQLRAQIVAAVIADRNNQAFDPAVTDRAEQVLTSIVRAWPGGPPPQAWIRRAAAEMLRESAWIRPAAPGCDCGATGGQGLVPTASREHADDCPAAADR